MQHLLQDAYIAQQVFGQIKEGYRGGQVFSSGDYDPETKDYIEGEDYWWGFDENGNIIID
jgi:hypothetical protein